MQWLKGCYLLGLFFVAGLFCFGFVTETKAAVVNEDLKIVASDGVNGDEFGFAISIDGGIMGIGARMYGTADQIGGAYIFESDGVGGYTQVKKLVPTDAATGDRIGNAVLVSGDYAYVAGYQADVNLEENTGAVWIFQKDAGGTDNWGQVAKLTAGTPIAGAAFGSSMAIDGNTLLVCAQNETYEGATKPGAAYLFQNDGLGNWSQVQRIQPSDYDPTDYFGQSCGIDGDTLVIGAHAGNKAYIFETDELGDWVESKILTVEGSSWMGTGSHIDGDTVVVGAYRTVGDELANAGAAYVFSRDEGGADNWGQVAQLSPSDGSQENGYFGIDTAIDGDKIVVGAYGQDGMGAAYSYEKTASGNWVGTGKLVPSDVSAGDSFGYRAALVDDMAIVGSIKASNGLEAVGAVYTFTMPPLVLQIPGDTDGNQIVNDLDAEVLANHWGQTIAGGASVGDFNSDGKVNALDASILAANWGNHTEAASPGTVPEPGVFSLLLTGIAWLGIMLRRRRSN